MTKQSGPASLNERGNVAGDFSGLNSLDQGVMDGVPVPCFLLNNDCIFLAGNESFYDLSGGNGNTFLGKDPYSLFAPSSAQHFRSVDQRLLELGGRISHEGVIESIDGRSRSVLFKKRVVVDKNGDKNILASVVDLSELQAIKTALFASESEKQAILDGFSGIICLFDAGEQVIWANDKVWELYGNPIGKTCHDVFCRTKEMCSKCAVPNSLDSGEVETTVLHFSPASAPHKELIFEITGTPVKDNEGQVTSVVMVGRDVTERHGLEKQLRHTQKMEAIGTLAGGIAHDFNNVLTPIMGYSEIIRLKMMRDKEPDEATLGYLDGILRAAKRAKSLVEQILTFSRSSEQKESLQHIHPIVKEVMKLMKVTLPSTIVIQENINEHCAMTKVDPVQIHQILINLCTNSSHAMAGGHGTLKVGLDSSGPDENGKEWIVLTVEDTGCGIPKEKLDRIFEPYYTTKEKSRGTGMGLAMVHGIVNRQGGKIEVQSTVAVGTRFTISLPVMQTATPMEHIFKAGDLQHGQGHILLVDDEAQVVQVTGELLKSLGYQVTGLTSAHRALELFQKDPQKFDLVLTDLTMPELTGVELCRKVKEARTDLPVVLFTGYSEQLSSEEGDKAGIDQYCMKPVSIKELSVVIAKTLGIV